MAYKWILELHQKSGQWVNTGHADFGCLVKSCCISAGVR